MRDLQDRGRLIRGMLSRAARGLKFHAIPLLIVAVASALGQAATLSQTLLSYMSWDTASYVVAAAKLAVSPHLIDTARTAGYPLFLALIFKLTGGVNYSVAITCNGGGTGGTFQPTCQSIFSPALVAQTALMILAVIECYLLTFRLSHRRLTACIVASLVGCNLYIITWERAMQTELLSICCIVTTFVVYERLVRRPRFIWAVLFATVSFVSIIVRPFNIYLPIVLLAVFLVRLFFLHELRSYWRQVLVSAVLLAGCVAGYMSLNARENGLFGLTWVTNVDVLGKVMEYRMQNLSVDPQYASVQSAVNQHVANPPAGYEWWDPWSVPLIDPAAGNFGMSQGGAYARNDIIRHPITYLVDSIPDIMKTWLAQPEFYAIYGRVDNGQLQLDANAVPGVSGYNVFGYGVTPTWDQPWWINALMLQSTIVLGAYWLLPAILLLLAVLVWRRPKNTSGFVMFSLALAMVSAIVLGATGNFDEFYRMRSPIDWGIIVLTVILAVEAISAISPGRASAPPDKGVLGREHLAASVESGAGTAPTGQLVSVSRTQSRPSTSQLTSIENVENLAHVETLKLKAAERHDYRYTFQPEHPEISVVLPCLNEEEAIGGCVDRIQDIIHQQHLSVEILVVDNASTDRSAEIAHERGARVVYQPVRGYGNAYLKGFAEARGTYIVMADADNTYDLTEVNDFVEPLRHGYDLVMGNRFAGRMAKGAMTFSHRYIGNPILSGILRLFFHTTVRDAHCGMRAFTRSAYLRMRLRTGGMEFASEMVINAAKAGLKIAERPISYAPRIGESKLHTVRDGWRHLRFMLLYSPTHLFLIPGLTLVVLGLTVEAVLTPGPLPLFGHRWDVHTMLLASVVALLGVQIVMLGLFARFFSLTEELDGERDNVLQLIRRAFTLERGLLLGGWIFAAGFAADAFVLGTWVASGMGQLALIRPTVIGSTCLAIGAEIIFGSFFLSFLQFRKTLHDPAAPLEDAASVRIPEPSTMRK